MKIELQPELIEILEENGFNVGEIEEREDGSWYIELSQYTPLGEDWYIIIDVDQPKSTYDTFDELFVDAFEKRTYSFDVDEEVEPYIEMRGKRGVPDSLKDLMEDAQWKNQVLLDTLYALRHDSVEEEKEFPTITIKRIDDQTVQVESNEITGDPVKFDKITDPKDQALIALCEFFGYEPSMVLNLDSIVEEEEATSKLELWKVFSIDGKEVCAYTLLGEGVDEEAATLDLLAAEHGISPDGIKVYVEER